LIYTPVVLGLNGDHPGLRQVIVLRNRVTGMEGERNRILQQVITVFNGEIVELHGFGGKKCRDPGMAK
jgi:hypothetical protein